MTPFLGHALVGPASANLRGCILSASLSIYMMRRVSLLFVLPAMIASAGLAQSGPYKVIKTAKVGGDGGFDYVYADAHPRVTHNTPFRAGKGFVYEGGLRIPLIVRWPGRVPAGRVVADPVIN